MDRHSTPRRLRGRLYGLSFIDEFGPLYAVYTLWFADNGVTASQISTVFVLWASVAVVLEIPSGALADRVDRRHLLAVAFGLRACGIAVWLVSPTYGGMLIGAVAWAVHSALASGAWEANIHDQLTAVDQADQYGPVIARVNQFSNVGIAAGAVVAFGVLEVGAPISALGWVTVAIHAVSLALVLTLPDVRWVVNEAEAAENVENDESIEHDNDEPTSYGEWLAGLRAGITEATANGPILRIVILGAMLEGLFIIDEYVPLLARARGVGDADVPLFVLVVWLGLLVGDELVARRPQVSGRTLGTALALGAGAMFAAIVSDAAPALMLIGVGYVAMEALLTTGDARLQERVGSRNRATVTSVRGLLVGLIGAAGFSLIGVMSDRDDPSAGLLVVLGVLVVVGLLATVWLPPKIAGQPGGSASPVHPPSS